MSRKEPTPPPTTAKKKKKKKNKQANKQTKTRTHYEDSYQPDPFSLNRILDSRCSQGPKTFSREQRILLK